ncbi:unnamed protein product [Strongylus vulgaris]|uniref:Lipocalin domain-containing protein n=1 Tax=Strongylus vulgaris TaxID=40348 RepID=A0A3P7KVS6_STRVU|nr:unnamed protein product [Strongylus vulgaris]
MKHPKIAVKPAKLVEIPYELLEMETWRHGDVVNVGAAAGRATTCFEPAARDIWTIHWRRRNSSVQNPRLGLTLLFAGNLLDLSTTSKESSAIPTINWRKSVSEKGARERRVRVAGKGIPVLPGVMGNLPGAGSCLPRGSPLVRDKSPSLFQNMLRNIPGAHDYLSSLLPSPNVDIDALMGKYQWAIDTPTAHNRFCATTEFQRAAQAGNSSSFSLQEKFRTNSEEGGEKVAFGYGIIHKDRTYVYMQDDPCPYQIVLVGPRGGGTGQYEYVILSNWARYPLIGLVRDTRVFHNRYKEQLESELEKEGFINDYSGYAVKLFDRTFISASTKLFDRTFISASTRLRIYRPIVLRRQLFQKHDIDGYS